MSRPPASGDPDASANTAPPRTHAPPSASPWLLAAGSLLAVVVLGVVAWGRVRPVEVPRLARWEGTMTVCPGRGVSVLELERAVTWWRFRGWDAVVSCDAWNVSVEVDPTLDTRASVEDVGTTHGVTRVHAQDGVVVLAEIRVLPGADALVLAHELSHALGFGHAKLAPTGHITHPHAPGWDGRGLTAPSSETTP